MRKEYTKPTLVMEEYNITTDIANLPSAGKTTYGDQVDASGDIWQNV